MGRKPNPNTEDILSMIREGMNFNEIAQAYGYAGANSISWIKNKYKRNVRYAVKNGESVENIAKSFNISVRTVEWLSSLPEVEGGVNNAKPEPAHAHTPKKDYGRVTNRSKIGVKVIHWDTEELLEMIDEEGYYIFDVSDPTHPEVKLLSELSLKEFKDYSKNPAAVLIKAAPEKERPVIIAKPVIEKIEKRTVGVSSPAFENSFDDWRNVPTPIVCQ